MIHVALFILTSVASTHWMRFAQGRGCRMDWVGAWTYLIGAACLGAWIAARGTPVTAASAAWGLSGGVALGVTYFFFTAAIRRCGVGIAHLARQLSVAVPVAASICIWQERVPLLRGIGLAIAAAGLFCLTAPAGGVAPASGRGPLWALPASLFAVAGVSNTLFKAYAAGNTPEGLAAYLFFLFLGAGITTVLPSLLVRPGPARRDFVYGLILALDNVLLNAFRVRSLETQAGVSAFPTMSLGVIVVSLAAAALLWKERYRGRVLVGVGLSLVALVFLNWRIGR